MLAIWVDIGQEGMSKTDSKNEHKTTLLMQISFE